MFPSALAGHDAFFNVTQGGAGACPGLVYYAPSGREAAGIGTLDGVADGVTDGAGVVVGTGGVGLAAGDAAGVGIGATAVHSIAPASKAIIFAGLEIWNCSTTAPSLSKSVMALLPGACPMAAQSSALDSLMWQSGKPSVVAR